MSITESIRRFVIGERTEADEKPAATGPVQAIWNGAVLAESDRTVVVEGNHYFPPEDATTSTWSPARARASASGRAVPATTTRSSTTGATAPQRGTTRAQVRRRARSRITSRSGTA